MTCFKECDGICVPLSVSWLCSLVLDGCGRLVGHVVEH
ncbi:MAG: hypothetical protein ACI9CA_001455, partial [Natronomonas sp.]